MPIQRPTRRLFPVSLTADDPPPAQEDWNKLPVRALLLFAPAPDDVDLLCRFVKDDLPKEGVNTLVMMIDYRYQFRSHPELADRNALSETQVKRIAQACRDAGVTLIPEMNLLAHQSEQEDIGILLRTYPQFDESPDLVPPHPWHADGEFGFYTKCLCTRHPDLLPVIFSLMDEVIDACEAEAFHAGLDEAWIVGHNRCPRCGGHDPAELFADYVTALHAHLAGQGCRMWMWSDRLIDGNVTGLHAWQASKNNTHRAIERIPKDILICDWKYEDAPPTPAYFAVKGFDVLPSFCYDADAALGQLDLVRLLRRNGRRRSFSPVISSRVRGIFATSWCSARDFIDAYHGTPGAKPSDNTENTVDAFKRTFAEIRKDGV
jgi:hypothetical protein